MVAVSKMLLEKREKDAWGKRYAIQAGRRVRVSTTDVETHTGLFILTRTYNFEEEGRVHPERTVHGVRKAIWGRLAEGQEFGGVNRRFGF